eukprot:1184975-Prorocentrum_minimum.AAC.1
MGGHPPGGSCSPPGSPGYVQVQPGYVPVQPGTARAAGGARPPPPPAICPCSGDGVSSPRPDAIGPLHRRGPLPLVPVLLRRRHGREGGASGLTPRLGRADPPFRRVDSPPRRVDSLPRGGRRVPGGESEAGRRRVSRLGEKLGEAGEGGGIRPLGGGVYRMACKSASWRASSSSMGSSKNWLIETSSFMPFLRRVLTMNSRARCCTGAGSSGRSTMERSRGSPGTMLQWSKYDVQNACQRKKPTTGTTTTVAVSEGV